MNSKQPKTLRAIFEQPTRSNIPWTDVISLFTALGADFSAGSGSKTRVALNGERAIFHRPHPENTTDKGAVESVRRLLIEAGVNIHDGI